MGDNTTFQMRMVRVTYFPITSKGSSIYPALNVPLAQALITFDSLKNAN